MPTSYEAIALTRTNNAAAFYPLFRAQHSRVGFFSDSTGVGPGTHVDWMRFLWHQYHGNTPCTEAGRGNGNFGNTSPTGGWLMQNFAVGSSAGTLTDAQVPPGSQTANRFGGSGDATSGQASFLNHNNDNDGATVGYFNVPDAINGGSAALAETHAEGGEAFIDMNAGLRLVVVAASAPGSAASLAWFHFYNASIDSNSVYSATVDSGTFGTGLDGAVGTAQMLQTGVLTPLTVGNGIHGVTVAANDATGVLKNHILSAWFASENDVGVHIIPFSVGGYGAYSLLTNHADCGPAIAAHELDYAILAFGVNDNGSFRTPAQFAADIEAMMDFIWNARSVKGFILSAVPCASADDAARADLYAEQLDLIVQATAYPCAFLNTRRKLDDVSGWDKAAAVALTFTSDGTHFTEPDSELVANATLALLKEAVLGTLNPAIVKDLMFNEAAPTTNYAANSNYLGSWTAPGNGIRFILDFGDISAIPAGSTVSSAILSLEASTVFGGVADPFSFHAMTRFNWNHAQATWNIYSTGNNWTTAGGDFEATNGRTSGLVSPATTGVKTYDIADTIQWILDNNPTTAQMIGKFDDEDAANEEVRYLSTESGGNIPALAIEFIPPAATATSLTINAAGQLVAVFTLAAGSWNTITTSAAEYFEIVGSVTGTQVGTVIDIVLAGAVATITVDFADPPQTGETVTLNILAEQFVDADGRTGPLLAGTAVTNDSQISGVAAPTVTSRLQNITHNDATVQSTFAGTTITARGVCWATTANPTTASSKTTDGTGEGSIVSRLTPLLASTLYYARTYATNAGGTTYGTQMQFTTPEDFDSRYGERGAFSQGRQGAASRGRR